MKTKQTCDRLDEIQKESYKLKKSRFLYIVKIYINKNIHTECCTSEKLNSFKKNSTVEMQTRKLLLHENIAMWRISEKYTISLLSISQYCRSS